MQTIENTPAAAQALFNAIIESGVTPVFDIDGICLNAIHRQKLFTQDHADMDLCTVDQIGQLNLDAYRVNTTAEQVALDKDMPLLKVIHMLNDVNKPYHVATARVVTACRHSTKLFKDRGIKPTLLMCRDGEHDQRRDSHLKTTKLLANFSQRQRENMVLIDDSLGNCKAVKTIGMKAIHVPFRGF